MTKMLQYCLSILWRFRQYLFIKEINNPVIQMHEKSKPFYGLNEKDLF